MDGVLGWARKEGRTLVAVGRWVVGKKRDVGRRRSAPGWGNRKAGGVYEEVGGGEEGGGGGEGVVVV